MWHSSLKATAAVLAFLTSQVLGQEDVLDTTQTAQVVSAKGVILDTILDWIDAARLDQTTYNGQKYGCKCYPGRPCWPSANKWNSLNRTVDGTLRPVVPAGAVCHNTFEGPFGTVQTYDQAACADAQANFLSYNEQWTYVPICNENSIPQFEIRKLTKNRTVSRSPPTLSGPTSPTTPAVPPRTPPPPAPSATMVST